LAKKKAAGGGAGRRGHGVMEVQTLSRSDSRGGRTPNPEREAILPIGACGVDRPEGSIGDGTDVLGRIGGCFSVSAYYCVGCYAKSNEPRPMLRLLTGAARRLLQGFRGDVRNACLIERLVQAGQILIDELVQRRGGLVELLRQGG